MKYAGSVSSEGGPILIVDAWVGQLWRGIDNDGSDYDRACKAIHGTTHSSGATIAINSNLAAIWDMGGAGIADVFIAEPGKIVLLRFWANAELDVEKMICLASLPQVSTHTFAKIFVTSGVLVILWATENGLSITNLNINEPQRPQGELSTDSAGLLVPVDVGEYECVCDKIALDDILIVRCIIKMTNKVNLMYD